MFPNRLLELWLEEKAEDVCLENNTAALKQTFISISSNGAKYYHGICLIIVSKRSILCIASHI